MNLVPLKFLIACFSWKFRKAWHLLKRCIARKPKIYWVDNFCKNCCYSGFTLLLLFIIETVIIMNIQWSKHHGIKRSLRSPLPNQALLLIRSLQQFRIPRPQISAPQYYIWSPERTVRWMRNTIEVDQQYKQTESNMQVTRKISSNN